MSTIGWFKHISANGLQRIKEDPEVFERVIFDLNPANNDAPLISDISELTSSQIGMLGEIMPDVKAVCNRWTEHDVEEVEFLKKLNPEIYEHLKLDLYSIITDEKNCFSIDISKSWSDVSNVFQCGLSMEQSICIKVVNNSDIINIFSGKLINPNDTAFGAVRYQEIDEVFKMAQVLSKIDKPEIRRRFEQALEIRPSYFRYSWPEESYPVLLEYCQEVTAFYEAAMIRGFGVVNAIG